MKIQSILSEAYYTKDGEEIELKREENFDDISLHKGFVLDKITAHVNGEEVGYLKIQNIPHKEFHKHYGTIYNWLTRFGGQNVLPYKKQSYHYEDLSNDERRTMLKDIVYMKFVPWGEETEYVAQFNDREVLEKIREFEDKLNRGEKGNQYRKFKNYHKDKPFVDFIQVKPDFRRQRIAEAMYLEAAKWMKERGMKFYAAGSQSKEAKAAWKHLAKKFKVKSAKGRKRKFLEPQAT